MALHNTTFTAIGNNTTRDSTADKGAVYYLDGNGTNGRLNIGHGAVWNVGDNTQIVTDGNPNHSYMNGKIVATGLVYIGKPNSGGRYDFSNGNGGLETTDLTYVYLGNGLVFNHLEGTNNVFSGFTRFIIDMDGGTGFVQFANREYQSVKLDVKPTNQAVLIIYPARQHAGYTSLPNFQVEGLTSLELAKGTTSTSHGRIYDPIYTGLPNNLLPMSIDNGTVANYGKEYFTLDVTAIANNNIKAKVIDEDALVIFENDLSDPNVTLDNYSGAPLVYYTGRKVIPCLVRTIGTTQSTTRKKISYTIRQKGFQQIKVTALAMNEPVVIKEMLTDASVTVDSSTVSGIVVDKVAETVELSSSNTPEQIYAFLQNWLVDNLEIDNFISLNGGAIGLSGSWSFVNNSNISGAFTDATVDGFLKDRDGADIRVINPANSTVIYEGANYSFLHSSLTVTDVKVYGNLEGIWLEKAGLVTLVQGANEVTFGVAGSITSLGSQIANLPQNLVDISGLETKAQADTRQEALLDAMDTDEMTATELHAALDSYTNKDDWKATVSSLETKTQADARQTLLMTGVTSANSHLTDIKGSGWTNAATLEFMRSIADATLEDTSQTLPSSLLSMTSKIDIVDSIVDSILSKINAGVTLTAAERQAVAVAVETSILDEEDGKAVLNAIVGAIGNTNITEATLVALIRADLERTGGLLEALPTLAEMEDSSNLTSGMTESDLHTGLDNYSNKDDWKASEVTLPTNIMTTEYMDSTFEGMIKEVNGSRVFSGKALENAPRGGGGGFSSQIISQEQIEKLLKGIEGKLEEFEIPESEAPTIGADQIERISNTLIKGFKNLELSIPTPIVDTKIITKGVQEVIKKEFEGFDPIIETEYKEIPVIVKETKIVETSPQILNFGINKEPEEKLKEEVLEVQEENDEVVYSLEEMKKRLKERDSNIKTNRMSRKEIKIKFNKIN